MKKTFLILFRENLVVHLHMLYVPIIIIGHKMRALWSTLLLFKKFSSEKGILAGLQLEPTSPCSREEIARALDHSATTTCWELELNNRIYNNLKLATTPKELEIHHGNFLWVSDSLSLPLIQKLLTDVYYQFSSKNSPLFSPWWVKKFFSKFFVKIFM